MYVVYINGLAPKTSTAGALLSLSQYIIPGLKEIPYDQKLRKKKFKSGLEILLQDTLK